MDTDIQDKIVGRLRRMGRGKVVTPKDFSEIGSRASIDQALSRLTKAAKIQRLGRGIYAYPRFNRRLGISVPPETDEIADAIARQTGSRVVPSGATAANRFGISTQVPAKPVYLTDGRSRKVNVGKFIFTVKHVPPKELPIGNRTSATVIQALRYVGKDAVNATVIRKIRRALSAKNLLLLSQDAQHTTDWIADVVQQIVGNKTEGTHHG